MVTADEMRLVSSEGCLLLAIGDRRWTSVSLEAGGTTTPLGAEDMSYLVKQLRAFLENPPPELKWIWTLSETHSSAYGKSEGERLWIRFQDRHAEFFAELRVSDCERKGWLADLQKIET